MVYLLTVLVLPIRRPFGLCYRTTPSTREDSAAISISDPNLSTFSGGLTVTVCSICVSTPNIPFVDKRLAGAVGFWS